MNNLFPEIEPNRSWYLNVGNDHALYIEESGQMEGLPVIFLHGGPGGGSSAYHRRFFNPQAYRIIIFDQRGCGRSMPHAELSNNTTWDLVTDIEKIREQLGIDKWLVFGGSWGSSLALAYAQSYPQRVLGLVLRGIFLCRKQDVDWFYQTGANRILPEAWEKYLTVIPPDERHDMLSAYYRRLTGAMETEMITAAKAWSIWEATAATLEANPDVVAHFSNVAVALAMARIEAHYFMHDSFFRDNQLLDDAHKIADVPGIIVHGRYDVVCPVDQAWALHKAWPKSELVIINTAGHAATEPGIVDALVAATESFAKRLK